MMQGCGFPLGGQSGLIERSLIALIPSPTAQRLAIGCGFQDYRA